jgi:DNA-binding NtrC family response regulator
LPLDIEDAVRVQDPIVAVSKKEARSNAVLFVDDEEEIRRIAKKFLESQGLSVYCAANGEEGINLFNQHSNEISFVVTDINMPKKNGVEMVHELLYCKPFMKFIVASAMIPSQHSFPRTTEFLPKPYAFDEVLRLILKNGT